MAGIVITLVTNTFYEIMDFVIFSSLTYLVIRVVMKFKYFKTFPKFTALPKPRGGNIGTPTLKRPFHP